MLWKAIHKSLAQWIQVGSCQWTVWQFSLWQYQTSNGAQGGLLRDHVQITELQQSPEPGSERWACSASEEPRRGPSQRGLGSLDSVLLRIVSYRHRSQLKTWFKISDVLFRFRGNTVLESWTAVPKTKSPRIANFLYFLPCSTWLGP